MSVLQIPIPVARTLFAPIMTARTAALVNRGSLETGRLVKVVTIVAFFWAMSFWGSSFIFWSKSVKTIPLYLSFLSNRHRWFFCRYKSLWRERFMFISVKMTIPFLYIFPYDQTSTSVLQFPIPVTRTLIAPTVTVPTAVLVNRGSLETGRLVKVITVVAF